MPSLALRQKPIELSAKARVTGPIVISDTSEKASSAALTR